MIGAMDILIQDHSNDKHIQLPEDTDAILHSLNTPTPFFIRKSGLGLTEPPTDEAWHSVVRMILANSKLSELPLSPSSPELEVLMLQGNVELTRIPNTFFCKMPLLSILDLSYTSVRELPDSLFELEQLREMYLKSCECFMKLSPKIGKLKKLEKLDLDGTQIIHLPEEIQELSNLQNLFLCFYEYRGRKGKQYTCSTIIPSEVLSKLKGLKHLSIDVNPDDERWYENVRDILPEILGLEHLLTLSLYIPHLELLKSIPDRIFQVDFRFIVGRHMKKIISSTTSTCEAKFKQSGCSLKFVNGDVVTNEIKRFVRHSKALFLERHKTIKSLSEFKMMNLEQLRICMLAECKHIKTIVDGRQSNSGNDIFSHLLYLYVSHMKSLRSIWEGPVPSRCFLGMLKSLVLQNCPELTTIFSMDFLGNLSLLKELIVRDCPKITTLISDGSFNHKGEVFLPKLRKIMLLHLPELITISNGCYIGPSLNNMAIYDCPKLQSLSRLELSSQTLEVKGEIKWWDQLQWSKEEWGISQRPSKFECMFSSIDNQVDIMTQFGNDGDDIDDDAADMTLPQTLFEHPKQNADSFSRRGAFSTWTEQSKSTKDGYGWKKYGQKGISGAKSPIEYFRRTHKNIEGCHAIKHVQRVDKEPFDYRITYHDHHTCTQTSSVPNSSTHNQIDLSTQSGVDDLADMTLPQTLFEHRMQNADSFSRKDKEKKTLMVPAPRFGNTEIPPDDGFIWRKYGQKEMLDSNFPRSYYRCTHQKLYGCPAKKQVQRLDNNPNIFAVTYRGSHTCHLSSTAPSSSVASQLILGKTGEIGTSETLDPSNHKVDKDRRDASSRWTESEVFDDASNTDFASAPFCEDPIVKEPYESNAESVSSVHRIESDLDSLSDNCDGRYYEIPYTEDEDDYYVTSTDASYKFRNGKHYETSYANNDNYAYSRDAYCQSRIRNIRHARQRHREEEDTVRQRRETPWLRKHNNRPASDSTPKYLNRIRQSIAPPSDFDLLLSDGIGGVSLFECGIPEEQKEHIRCSLVSSGKDFVHIEKIDGRDINILQGLELHKQVFNAEEQMNIVRYVYKLQQTGQNGYFKERTYSEPKKWMRGKGRVTIQFGCCYNYARDKHGNPPGILRDEEADPLPILFKKMIKRLVRWHILPATCIPNSCVVNIYEEGDCIPPHIDHHDFVRPVSTVSLLSECDILFGSNLKVVCPGEFQGPASVTLPVGSVFIFNGNGADIAKHCIQSVPTKRISITFRRMDDSKLPYNFSPDPELEGIKPLSLSTPRKTEVECNNFENSENKKHKTIVFESEAARQKGHLNKLSS